MAMNYHGSPNGLFIQLGAIAKQYFLQKTDATDLDTDLAAILNTFEAMTSGAPALMVETFATSIDGWKTQHVGRRATLVALALKRLQDRVTVLDEIAAITTEQAEILAKLIKRMIIDGESIDASTVTASATATAAGWNVGNGSVLTTKLLDGVTSPGSGAVGEYPANENYANQLTQLVVPSENMRWTCTADNFADATGEGDETFSWEGRLADVANGFGDEGSGAIGSLQPINGGATNILANGDFEEWVDNLPTAWVLVSGDEAVHVVQEATGADVYHGAYSLQLVGDGAEPSIEIYQLVSPSLLTAKKMYCFACRMKVGGAGTAGNILIQFEGAGYTAATDEKIDLAYDAVDTAWQLCKFFVLLPAIIPSDFKLVIRYDDTGDEIFWIDDLAFAPVTYGGGLGAAIVRGSAPAVRGDMFSTTVSNNDAGTFQKFFRQVFGVQLPSNAAGGETILDSLAE